MICHDDYQRRARVRQSHWNGLDYVEVVEEQDNQTGKVRASLTICFLGKAPPQFDRQANEPQQEYEKRLHSYVRIEGGRRIRDIRVKDVEVRRSLDPERDDALIVTVDRVGDFSTYTLRLVGLEGTDPRYDHLNFNFKVDCPSDLDCAPTPCPPAPLVEPEINYLAKDYASFRQLILDRLALTLPGWRERHAPDLGIALVELLAYVGDHLSYYQDAVATEAYLDTARQRISVRRHARLVDYQMHEGCNARAWICVEVENDLNLEPREAQFITGLNDPLSLNTTIITEEQLRTIPAQTYEVFEPMSQIAIALHVSHNEIRFYTWDEHECCLPRGATSATLKDAYASTLEEPVEVKLLLQPAPPPAVRPRQLQLEEGDVLIFEEVIGPKTGDPADADLAHRHAVRLTQVKPGVDPLNQQPILEIEWALEDALPFPLCLSALADDCRYIDNISLAHGNMVLVDHGNTLAPENLGEVPTEAEQAECECEGHPGEVTLIPGRFRPTLKEAPLTFREPLLRGHRTLFDMPAAQQLAQDPRAARPQAWLVSEPDQLHWEARLDLFDSGPDDPHFVIEMDNDAYAHLRFGDGELGQQPEARAGFTATYRIGNGARGNVGAEAIRHLYFRKTRQSGGYLSVRNPLPAHGGQEPEPMVEAKLLTPTQFRVELQRAITAEDYAHIVQRDFKSKVQRAAAALNWNGSWYEVQVAVDPMGNEALDEALRQQIANHLERYRRIGHDVSVQGANYVPLDVELTVCALPNYLRGHVKAALLEVFSSRSTRGLFHPDNLTFGKGVYLSKLIAAAQAVTGVESVQVKKLQRLGEPANHEIENGVLALGPLEVARLDNDPSFPEHGQLKLDVRGGR